MGQRFVSNNWVNALCRLCRRLSGVMVWLFNSATLPKHHPGGEAAPGGTIAVSRARTDLTLILLQMLGGKTPRRQRAPRSRIFRVHLFMGFLLLVFHQLGRRRKCVKVAAWANRSQRC